MSLIEKIILIIASLLPIVSLMMVLPKIIKRKADKEIPQEPIKEEPKPQPNETATEMPKPKKLDDFSDFAEIKKKKVSAPKRNFPKPEFDSFIKDFPPPRRIEPKAQEKSIKEEINSLSPQLKALIISGALDRKYFDN